MATDNLRLFPPLREYEGLLACFQRSNSNNFSVTTCPNTVIRIVVTQTKPEGLLKDKGEIPSYNIITQQIIQLKFYSYSLPHIFHPCFWDSFYSSIKLKMLLDREKFQQSIKLRTVSNLHQLGKINQIVSAVYFDKMSHFSIINYKENDLNKHFTYYMPTSSLWVQTYIIPKNIRSSIRWALFSCIT